jgi:hypothetical protein
MDLPFWQLLAVKLVLGSILAFGFAWFIRSQSVAYLLGLFSGLLVVVIPSCAPIFQSSPIAANEAGEKFFWISLPLLLAWLVSTVIVIGFARMIRWKE